MNDAPRSARGPLATVTFVCLMLGAANALALPLYGARSGRTCDNCHSQPNTWYDPAELGDRKCTLSCNACHVDPNGGGLRTVSGRYFGDSTMPMFGAAAPRPLDDRDDDFFESMRTPPAEIPASGPVVPQDRQRDPRPMGSPPADQGWLTLGAPAGHAEDSTAVLMGWLGGRYGDRRADPLLNVGADARLALWSPGLRIFPMQADVYAAIHPIDHVTVATTVGARGRTRSLAFIGDGLDDQPIFAVKDLWVMAHELPYMAWVRAGRFMPAFGTRIADHTAGIRRHFGQGQDDPANRVLGVEVGLTPNYPFVTASAFVPSTPAADNPVEPGEGWGAALTGGYRALGWQAGASAMIRRRPLEAGGDTNDVSLHGALNPWFYASDLPLTWLFEVAAGTYQRPLSGNETARFAVYHQLAWTLYNGVIGRLRYDLYDPDIEVIDDEFHRPGLGLDWTVIPGFTVNVDLRVGIGADGPGDPPLDLFVQLHGWL